MHPSKMGDLPWDRLDDTVSGDWVEFGEVPVEPQYESTPMTYSQPQCLCCPKHHHTPLEWDRCVLKCTVSRCKTAYPLSWFFWERNAARLLDEGLPWWELTMKPHAWTPLHLGLITMPFPEPEGPVSIQVRGFGPHHYAARSAAEGVLSSSSPIYVLILAAKVTKGITVAI